MNQLIDAATNAMGTPAQTRVRMYAYEPYRAKQVPGIWLSQMPSDYESTGFPMHIKSVHGPQHGVHLKSSHRFAVS